MKSKVIISILYIKQNLLVYKSVHFKYWYAIAWIIQNNQSICISRFGACSSSEQFTLRSMLPNCTQNLICHHDFWQTIHSNQSICISRFGACSSSEQFTLRSMLPNCTQNLICHHDFWQTIHINQSFCTSRFETCSSSEQITLRSMLPNCTQNLICHHDFWQRWRDRHAKWACKHIRHNFSHAK